HWNVRISEELSITDVALEIASYPRVRWSVATNSRRSDDSNLLLWQVRSVSLVDSHGCRIILAPRRYPLRARPSLARPADDRVPASAQRAAARPVLALSARGILPAFRHESARFTRTCKSHRRSQLRCCVRVPSQRRG